LSREAAEQLKNLGYMDEDTHHPATNP